MHSGMTDSTDDLPDDIERLKALLRAERVQKARLVDQKERLVQILRQLRRNHVGRKSEIVQLDTLHIGLVPGKSIRHFTGYCPVGKGTVAKAFNRATAESASLFLDKLVADMPFKIDAIQVHGGSEFMAEFETECERRSLTLYMLPPRSPQLNGGVERCNGAWRYELDACIDLPENVEALSPLIDDWQDTYNFVRPHGALSRLTPAEYHLIRQANENPAPSHMS